MKIHWNSHYSNPKYFLSLIKYIVFAFFVISLLIVKSDAGMEFVRDFGLCENDFILLATT